MSCVYENSESTMALAASAKKDNIAAVCRKYSYTPQVLLCQCIQRPLRTFTTMKHNTFKKLNHMITTGGVDLSAYIIVSQEPICTPRFTHFLYSIHSDYSRELLKAE